MGDSDEEDVPSGNEETNDTPVVQNDAVNERDPDQGTSGTSRISQKTSMIWEHFQIMDTDSSKAVCNHCDAQVCQDWAELVTVL